MTTPNLPFVTVIIPIRNEGRYIAACLRTLLHSSYPPTRWEIIIADGMSEDNTRAEIAQVARMSSVPIIVVDNPRRITPVALNVALAHARGEIIVRVDAHAEYGNDYLYNCVRLSEETGAGCVGGVLITKPGAATPTAHAIAIAMAHPFGVGDSKFRIGSERRDADTVPFGCYRTSVFQRLGVFDERLTRHQDYDMNQRIRHAGERVVLDPRIHSIYYARPTLRALVRKAWDTGYWNAMALHLRGHSRCLRHTLPAGFALGLVAALALAAWEMLFALPRGLFYMAVPIWVPFLLYALLDVLISSRLALRHGVRQWPALLVIFPAFHFHYGAGYVWGWINTLLRRYPWQPTDGIPTWDEIRIEDKDHRLAA